MPQSFSQLRDGTIRIITERATYDMSQEEFAELFKRPIPRLPEGINQRIYEPGVRHPLSIDVDVVDGGEMPWPEGDEILARADVTMRAKQVAAHEAAVAVIDERNAAEKVKYDEHLAQMKAENDARVEAFLAHRQIGLDKLMEVLVGLGVKPEDVKVITDHLWLDGRRKPQQ